MQKQLLKLKSETIKSSFSRENKNRKKALCCFKDIRVSAETFCLLFSDYLQNSDCAPFHFMDMLRKRFEYLVFALNYWQTVKRTAIPSADETSKTSCLSVIDK